jgi:hypothetical protein
MLRFLAARGCAAAACVFIVALGPAYGRAVVAQSWNDPRSLTLVAGATQRRAEQLADTGLADYRATAHGYVTFLAQLGEGLRTPPKVIKADELALEVYWHAPNLSKQRIVGRRDTLLLPTDIAYHRDHLGIVQNNFPNIIRIGEGDEVADVPHPLSPAGLREYDFALADSFAIGAGAQRINVYEIKVRPKDDKKPRVAGAIYIDPSGGQVVRMNFGFTRAAFLDNALEDLSIVLENRLVGGRFWLPSRQEIEIERRGTWLDYPVRGIIRGRWEIGDYQFNTSIPTQMFVGPEIVQAPPAELKGYKWTGRVLDSLPPDVRAVSEPDIARVQSEVRQLVRAQALARAQAATLSARNVSDFARFDRAEGLAFGAGLSKQFGAGVISDVRARYGSADKLAKGSVELGLTRASGSSIRAFASRDYRDLGDVAERSMAVNSLAAQEFASDYTDPYLVRAAGLRVEVSSLLGFDATVGGALEWQSPVAVRATPVTGTFIPTVPVADVHALRWALDLDRPASLWLFGTELAVHAQTRLVVPQGPAAPTPGPVFVGDLGTTLRGSLVAQLERPVGDMRLVTATTVAGVGGQNTVGAPQRAELVYLGGPVSAPGYDYHSLVSDVGATEHLEWRVPAPFIPFSLGRFGRVPARGSFAPYAHFALLGQQPLVCTSSAGAPGSRCPSVPQLYPAFGAAYLFPFDVLRIDVARGVARGGRWTFNLDVSREFWSIF